MSLVIGLILHTLEQPKKVSQHSMLMRFYKLRKEITAAYDADYKKAFHDINIYFAEVESISILKALNII